MLGSSKCVLGVQRQGVGSSQSCFQRGSQSQRLMAGKNVAVVTMRKKGIHPEWYEEAKVVCNGEEVLTTSGTQPGYNVDIWSGNHPFFQGVTTSVVTDEGRVNKFKRRFAGLDSLSAVETTSSVMEKQKEGKK